MSVAVEGNETRSVIASLLGEPGVASLHDTNGRWDLLAELRAGNLSELSQVLERIRLIRGISSTETSIHLETYRLLPSWLTSSPRLGTSGSQQIRAKDCVPAGASCQARCGLRLLDRATWWRPSITAKANSPGMR
jgi:hypothetical protein